MNSEHNELFILNSPAGCTSKSGARLKESVYLYELDRGICNDRNGL
jgi:hypothetical protein